MKTKILIFGILIFLISFFVFLKTICPTVFVGDNGELVVGAYTLGIPHPPGYPLFCIFGKIFTFLPFGSIAFQVNLMNAFFAAVSVFIFYKLLILTLTIILKISIDNTIVFISGVIALYFAFSNSFWSQIVVSEVYIITTFFVILELYILMLWKNSLVRNVDGDKYLYLLSLVYGVSLAAHHTMTLFAPLLVLYLLLNNKENSSSPFEKGRGTHLKDGSRGIYKIIGFFLLGICIQMYLPIRSLANPLLDWGNPDSFNNFIFHVLRKQYGVLAKEPRSIALFLKQCFAYANFLFDQFNPFLLVFIIFGFLKIVYDKKYLIFSVIAFLFLSIGFILLLNFKIIEKDLYLVQIFFIPSYVIILIWITFGIKYLWDISKTNYKFIRIGLMGILFVLLILSFKHNYSVNDKSKNYVAYNFANNILRTLEPNSILFSRGDNPVFLLSYLRLAEGVRNDVTIYDDFGCIFTNIYGEGLLFMDKSERDKKMRDKQKEIINSRKEPIFFTLGSNMQKIQGLITMPAGVLYRVIRPWEEDSVKNKNYWKNYELNGINDSEILSDFLAREMVARYYFGLGEYYHYTKENDKSNENYRKAMELARNIEWMQSNLASLSVLRGNKDEAIKDYERIVAANPKNAIAYNNLGVAYLEKEEFDRAMVNFRKAIGLEQDYADAHNNLGNVYYKTGQRKEAYDEYNVAIKLNPEQADAHCNIGDMYLEQGKLDLAEEKYIRVLGLNQNHKKAHSNLGIIYYSKGKVEDAIREFSITIKLDSNNPDAYNNLGSAYGRKGDLKTAISCWEKALQINPSHKDAKENIIKAKAMLK
ncbi:MAG: tetratricopeptide repeat protein [Candidatus Firestonebacteria bacterium]